MRIISAIEADYVVFLIFDPDSSHETSGSRAFLGLNVNYEATDLPEELPAHEREVVIFFLKVSIEHHHLGETKRQKPHGVNVRQSVQHATPETGLPNEGRILRAIAHIKPPEKVLVFHRNRVAVAVRLEILKISFNHGPQ